MQAAARGELSVHRGEAVDVLDDSSGAWWQVKNKFGAVGNAPAHMFEVIVKKTHKGGK